MDGFLILMDYLILKQTKATYIMKKEGVIFLRHPLFSQFADLLQMLPYVFH